MKDARAAVEMVRKRAAEWKIDPARVGMLGFSAGAEVTLAVSVYPEKEGRPNFFGSIYGPLSSRTVPEDSPAMFAALAMDDPIMGGRGLDLIGQYRAAKRPMEVHLFEHGGHAFGLVKQNTTSDLWVNEYYEWLKDRGLLAAQSAKPTSAQ